MLTNAEPRRSTQRNASIAPVRLALRPAGQALGLALQNRMAPGERAAVSSDAKAEGDSGAQGNTIEQVRDLLFGAEAKAQRDEINNLRKQMERSLQKLESSLSERIDALADRVRTEVRSLQEALTRETGERTESVDASNEQITLTKTSLAELADATTTEAQLQRAALAAAKAELTALLEAASSDLDGRKADRSALAGLLKGMAVELESAPAAGGKAVAPARSSSKR
ncbi:MAG: hypothetical protein JJU22_00790 [Gammaproteobacteria bacterium]|nr:hypothetical protein [Gammaproteobacteria bacterium]